MSYSDYCDYFPGGVPPGVMFKMTLSDLQELLKLTPDKDGINRAAEILFVGLISYFEGFLKEVFASAINIDNTLLENLGKNGQDVSIDSRRLLVYGTDYYKKIGFVVSEKFDFGTAKKINSLYLALLRITPLAKDAATNLDRLLNDRHLIVHHGANYTLSYLEQTKATKVSDAYWQCLTINKAYFNDAFKFIEDVSIKLLKSISTALKDRSNTCEIPLTPAQSEAIDALGTWGP